MLFTWLNTWCWRPLFYPADSADSLPVYEINYGWLTCIFIYNLFLDPNSGWFDTKNHQPYVLKEACGHSFFFPASDVSSKAGRSIGGSSPGGTWPVARWTVGQRMWGFNQQTPGFSQKTLGFKQSENQRLHEVNNSHIISISISVYIYIIKYIYIITYIYIYHQIYIYIYGNDI